jgi:hypothetical protein
MNTFRNADTDKKRQPPIRQSPNTGIPPPDQGHIVSGEPSLAESPRRDRQDANDRCKYVKSALNLFVVDALQTIRDKRRFIG